MAGFNINCVVTSRPIIEDIGRFTNGEYCVCLLLVKENFAIQTVNYLTETSHSKLYLNGMQCHLSSYMIFNWIHLKGM